MGGVCRVGQVHYLININSGRKGFGWGINFIDYGRVRYGTVRYGTAWQYSAMQYGRVG